MPKPLAPSILHCTPTGPSALRSQSAGHLRKGSWVPHSTAAFWKAEAAPVLLCEKGRPSPQRISGSSTALLCSLPSRRWAPAKTWFFAKSKPQTLNLLPHPHTGSGQTDFAGGFIKLEVPNLQRGNRHTQTARHLHSCCCPLEGGTAGPPWETWRMGNALQM